MAGDWVVFRLEDDERIICFRGHSTWFHNLWLTRGNHNSPATDWLKTMEEEPTPEVS